MLVGIVNFGRKNDSYLRLVLDGYRSMPWKADIVVLSNEPKSLPHGVELRVLSVPQEPMHFPMHLRQLLYDRHADYDLFAGTEDDVLLLPVHAKAFLECAEFMGTADVPGFLRYEIGTSGLSVHDMHAHFWWDLDSVRKFGPWAMAQPTNLHSAAYLLTREHLEKAVASGHFLDCPVRTRDYGLLEESTTHLYTHCGLRKWVPIDRLDDFLLHHLPNKYIGRLGVPLDEITKLVAPLSSIACGESEPRCLFPSDSSPLRPKCFEPVRYEEIRGDLLAFVPKSVSSILWFGSTSGATELELQKAGIRVTCVPMDSVHEHLLREKGLDVTEPRLHPISLERGAKFDAIILPGILSRISDPVGFLTSLAENLTPIGQVIASEWNCDYLIKRGEISSSIIDGDGDIFSQLGCRPASKEMITKWFLEGKFKSRIKMSDRQNPGIGALKKRFRRIPHDSLVAIGVLAQRA
jgi:hypothetical protein